MEVAFRGSWIYRILFGLGFQETWFSSILTFKDLHFKGSGFSMIFIFKGLDEGSSL